MGVTTDVDIEGESPSIIGSNYRAVGSQTDITTTIGGTTIFNFNGAGKLEHFFLSLEDKSIEVELIIDGVSTFQIDCRVWDDAGTEPPYTAALPFVYDKQDRNFTFFPKASIKFDTSFEVKGYGTKKIKGHVYSYILDS